MEKRRLTSFPTGKAFSTTRRLISAHSYRGKYHPPGDGQRLADDLVAGLDLDAAAFADESHRAALGGDVEGRLLGGRSTGAVDGHVDAAATERGPDGLHRVLFLAVDGCPRAKFAGSHAWGRRSLVQPGRRHGPR
jgi:hypothetical protein